MVEHLSDSGVLSLIGAGPIVRIAPNELSFTNPSAWKDIYSSRPGQPNFPRDPIDSRFDPVEDTGVLSTDMLVADEPNHARQRRTLSHAFSMKAITGQEQLISQFVDLFIAKVAEQVDAGSAVDMNKWFNYLTFDVIGELAFGESFNCMATGKQVAISPSITSANRESRCLQLLGLEYG